MHPNRLVNRDAGRLAAISRIVLVAFAMMIVLLVVIFIG